MLLNPKFCAVSVQFVGKSMGGIDINTFISGFSCKPYSIHSLNPSVLFVGEEPAVIPKYSMPPLSKASFISRCLSFVESFQKLIAHPLSPPRNTSVLLWFAYPSSAATTSSCSAYGLKKLFPIRSIRCPRSLLPEPSSLEQADKNKMAIRREKSRFIMSSKLLKIRPFRFL